LEKATVVAGGDALEARAITWGTVIEWPVEEFVAQGEFVLTTGLGCDSAMFTRLAREIAQSGASALCVGVGPSAPFKHVPASVRRVGEQEGLPIIELPWEIRFADVVRRLASVLLVTQFHDVLSEDGGLPVSFTNALLHPDSLNAIVQAIEEMIRRPAIILDAGLSVIAVGARAKDAAIDIDAAGACAVEAYRVEDKDNQGRSADADPVSVAWLESLEARAAVVAPAIAQGVVVAYVVVVEVSDPRQPAISKDTLRHAAVAVAIEVLRRRAAAEAESRVRGNFLWELASGEQPGSHELAVKAGLLGYSLDDCYRVMVVESRSESESAGAVLDALVRALLQQSRGEGLEAARRGNRVLVIVPNRAQADVAPRALAERLSLEFGGGDLIWGIANGEFSLAELGDGVCRAGRVMEVGYALHGAGDVFDSTELAPFLVLATLADSEEAIREADAVLEPLVLYDHKTSRGLLNTLEIYLLENGNAAMAARRLFLNRRSLLYRLKRIEELTGRNLDQHEDRFLFDLSLRIHRLREFRS